MSLSCILLPGCVSEQWVRGYVQHELAGVRDIVTEEVYPVEKAVIGLKTQMASITVELKEVANEVKAVKEAPTADDKKWEEMQQKVAGIEKDLNRLQTLVENLQSALGEHRDLIQSDKYETASEGTDTTQGEAEQLQKP